MEEVVALASCSMVRNLNLQPARMQGQQIPLVVLPQTSHPVTRSRERRSGRNGQEASLSRAHQRLLLLLLLQNHMHPKWRR